MTYLHPLEIAARINRRWIGRKPIVTLSGKSKEWGILKINHGNIRKYEHKIYIDNKEEMLKVIDDALNNIGDLLHNAGYL